MSVATLHSGLCSILTPSIFHLNENITSVICNKGKKPRRHAILTLQDDDLDGNLRRRDYAFMSNASNDAFTQSSPRKPASGNDTTNDTDRNIFRMPTRNEFFS